MSDGRRASGRSLIGALGVMLALPLAAQGRAPLQWASFQPPAVYREALAAVATCAQALDAACVKRGFTSFSARLAAEIDPLPSGRAGLGAWLRFAARLYRGSTPPVPAVQRMPLRRALETLYAHTGLALDDEARTRLHEQLAGLSARESEEIAHLVGAFDLSLSLAARARGDSGIERWARDPRRAHLLATQAVRTPTQASVEARELVHALTRVDMEMMTRAALVMADALGEFDASVLQGTLDLPLVFIGGEGDTAHTEDRLLLVDVSGRDVYRNNAGGGIIRVPAYYQPVSGAVAVDFGADDDVYERDVGAQGQAVGGVGLLYDEGGSDVYRLTGDGAGQGFTIGGVAALYDAGAGDDAYETPWLIDLPPVGTKASAIGGVGLLVDEGGSDSFRHDGITSMAWGAAGGLALLANLGDGDDVYASRPKEGDPDAKVGQVQGIGVISGAGILLDEGGDDQYVCALRLERPCQGGSQGNGLGLVWDRSGDDSYQVGEPPACDLVTGPSWCGLGVDPILPYELPPWPAGQGAGYSIAYPPGLGVLHDESGDDRYFAPRWAQGFGSLGGVGLLLDRSGKDMYHMNSPLVGIRADGQRWIDGLVGIGIDE